MLVNISKKDKHLFCANAVINIAKKENIRVFALTSSLNNPEKQSLVSKTIADNIKQLGKNVLFLDMNSVTAEEIQKQLDQIEDNNNFDFIFVNLQPVKNHFNSLQIAAKCQGTLLLEKYTQTKHQVFDELMDLLKQNDIHVCGIVTY